jgi:hypothetical protein
MGVSGWSIVLPFDTDDPEFTRGFEAGRLWERIKSDRTNWSQIVHASNTEMVMRMCELESRSFRSEDIADNEVYIQVWID